MKKVWMLLLCLALAAFVLAGCSGDENVPQGGGETTAEFNLDIPEDYTFRIGLVYNWRVTDYENNALTRWLKEETGYNIDFVTYTAIVNNANANVNIAMEPAFLQEGDKLPDILLGIDLGQAALNSYGEKGEIVDLSPYFGSAQWSEQWRARLNDLGDREFADYVTRKLYADDGESIYAFPTVEYSRYDLIRHQVFINQGWLDTLEQPMPTNADQLYDTLVAFKTRDPNGNRKTDEIPLMGRNTEIISWIVNMFCYMEDARTWRADENGEISGFYWDDDYRKALIFLHKLFKEGLMPKDVFTMRNEDVAEWVNPAEGAETVGIWVGHPSEILTAGSDAVNIYKAMPQWGYAVTDIGNIRSDTVVTSDCAYPAGAWKILMALSSEEGYYRMRYGEKGVDWVEAAPGVKSYAGLPRSSLSTRMFSAVPTPRPGI